MKRRILMTFMIIISGIFSGYCFAAENSTITFSCDTTSGLTKYINIEATSNVIVNWGDGVTEEFPIVVIDEENSTFEVLSINHTYSRSGTYNVSLSATQITRLEMKNDDIYEIDLSQAVMLKTLNLNNNKLQTLDLSNNTLLNDLSCVNNYLTNINLVSSEINVINCSNNELKSLSIPNTLTELYVSNNNLEAVNDATVCDFSDFSRLKILECLDNNITELILTGCTALEKIDFSYNFVQNISFEDNLKLKEIYCNGNSLSTLDVTNNNLLNVLNCSRNNITNLNLSSSNVNLKELYAWQNQIVDIDLNNIGCELVIIDDVTNVTNNNAASLVKIGVSGNLGFYLDTNKCIIFSNVPSELSINGVEQVDFTEKLDISGYIGVYTINAVFSENEEEYMIVNRPSVLEGMIPLKYNGRNWVITNPQDSEWYNYSDKEEKWANVMLRDGAKYIDLDGSSLKDVGETPLNELVGKEVPVSNTGSMYVWIPRFTYKITDNDVKIKYSQNTIDDVEDGYKVHPAFNYTNYLGGDALLESSYESIDSFDKYSGIWVAKYPAGNSIASPKYSSNSTIITNSSIGDAFSASKLVTTSDMYGINNGSSHMMKNSEWGAVAYLTTAVGNLSNNSTTGNIYGIYEMERNAEYVSNFIELVGGISNVSVRKNGRNLLPYEMITYSGSNVANLKDIEILKLKSAKDDAVLNYSTLGTFYGIGINEINTNISGMITANVPTGNNAFFVRGIDGLYSYSGSDGASNNNIGFRNVIFATNSVDNEVTSYIIKASIGEGGTITPEGKTVVLEGDNLIYSIRPNDGYEITDVIVDGVSVYYDIVDYGSYVTYTFENVSSNHEIVVTLDGEILPYEVSVTKNPSDVGIIEGEGTHNSRSMVTLKANRTDDYKFSSWEIIDGLDDVIDTTSSEISFKMPGNNVVLKANFEKILKAMLIVENMYEKMYMEKDVGVSINIRATLNDGYVFTGWTGYGVSLSEEEKMNPEIEITMPSNDVTLVANYNKLYPVTVLLGDGTKVVVEYEETKEVILRAPLTVDGKSFTGWSVVGLPEELPNETDANFNMPGNVVTIMANYN